MHVDLKKKTQVPVFGTEAEAWSEVTMKSMVNCQLTDCNSQKPHSWQDNASDTNLNVTVIPGCGWEGKIETEQMQM